ncbi:hypothetical protein [Pseudomonas moraviensis]|uniref:Glucosyl transferase GtrII n=1 Tax=Pseudomonas moraviensis TaxID=321662 RepID=A0A7Z0AUK7_9PSED|nr:hypothetical protein [Pseudomonas moraviensis]NYH10309.1 hypothetical protein [Pseudomonas moraviensis]
MVTSLIQRANRGGAGLLLAGLFLFMAYVAYALPMLYAYFESVNFVYVNAWDEETYLSYQGALGSLTVPGYWASGAIVYVLQNIGLSGGEVNILFDCVLTPVTCVLLVQIFREINIGTKRAMIYAGVVLCSPILFNLANPLLSGLTRTYGALGYGWEYYQSALRSPEPQLSYFLVALGVLSYLKSNKFFWLLLITPFLYFFVGVSYAYFLVCGVILLNKRFFKREAGIVKILIACVASYLCVSLGFVLFDWLFLSKDPFIGSMPDAYVKRHSPMLPISGLLSAFFVGVQVFLKQRFSIVCNRHIQLQFFIMLSLLLLCNIHVVSGVMLSYKNYLDYSTSLVAGISIVIFLDFLKVHGIKGAGACAFAVSLSILYLTFRAYGLDFSKLEYRYFRGLQFDSVEEYNAATIDPMSIVIMDSDLSAKLPYSVSRMPIPLFSYQYNFPLVANGCRPVLERMQHVFTALKDDPKVSAELNFAYMNASIQSFSGQKYVPLSEQKDYPLSRFCGALTVSGNIKVLEHRFKDDGWITFKLF